MHNYKWTDDPDKVALVWNLLDKPLTATLGADATHNQRVKHMFGTLLGMSMPGDQLVGLLELEFWNALDVEQYPAYSSFIHEIERLNGQWTFAQRQLAKLASADPYADYLAEISKPKPAQRDTRRETFLTNNPLPPPGDPWGMTIPEGPIDSNGYPILETKPVDVPASPIAVQVRSLPPVTASKRRAPVPASTTAAVESIWYTTNARREAEYAKACKRAKKLHPSQRFEYMHRESQRIFSK